MDCIPLLNMICLLIIIWACRHPLQELLLDTFVPNDTESSFDKGLVANSVLYVMDPVPLFNLHKDAMF